MKKLLLFLVLIIPLVFLRCNLFCPVEESHIVDDVIGVYKGELVNSTFTTLYEYKVEVVKLSASEVRITPVIGNEFRWFEVELHEVSSGLHGPDLGDRVYFNLLKDPIELYFEDDLFGDEFNGYFFEE